LRERERERYEKGDKRESESHEEPWHRQGNERGDAGSFDLFLTTLRGQRERREGGKEKPAERVFY